MIHRTRYLAFLWGPLVLVSLSAGCSSSDDDCDGCTIDGECVAVGAQSSDDPCFVCNPEVARTVYTPRVCDDAVACNGEETCDADTGQCTPGAVLCPDDEFCDTTEDQCVVSCYYCSIDRTCFVDYQRNPANPCQVCNSTLDAYAWTDNDGAVCDDGVFCNGADTCAAGVCSEHGGDPCEDDGQFCNGSEVCDEDAGACVHTQDVCGAGESCDESGSQCCTAADHLGCDANGDVVWIDSCGQDGALQQDCPDAPHGTCTAGECACSPGWTGPGCAQCVVFVSTSGDDNNAGNSWSQAKATLQEALITADASSCGAIWLAEGTYPTSYSDDPTEYFLLTAGLHVYGGFAGTETTVEQRDVAAHPTVLDGEFGDPADPFDNACNIMIAAAGTLVDGITFTGASNSFNCGAASQRSSALQANNVNVTVKNCTFIGNGFQSLGDGAVSLHGTAHAVIRNTLFEQNEGIGGGVVLWSNAFAELSDCVFRQNAGTDAAAIHARSYSTVKAKRCQFEDNAEQWTNAVVQLRDNSHGVLHNCTFMDNSVYYGPVFAYGDYLLMVNCLFAGNDATYAGALRHGGDGPAIVHNCTMVANTGDDTGGINSTGDFLFVRNSILWGNTSNAATVTESQLLHSVNTLPSVQHTTLQGATVFAGVGNDNSDPLFINGDPGVGPINLHLTSGSPCIDTGNTQALMDDQQDLDGDTDLMEPIPVDLEDNTRVTGTAVDRGVYETP